MKKCITLLLLIMSSKFVYAMEYEKKNDSSLLSFSYFPGWLSFNQLFDRSKQITESKLISDIRASKNKFENQLQYKSIEIIKTNMPSIQIFSAMSILRLQHKDVGWADKTFLAYCYYQNFHKDEVYIDLNQLKELDVLNICRKAQIDGHSGFSATMAAKNTSFDTKRNFIQELIKLNFTLTPKDIELAKLIFYDEIITQSKPRTHILYSQANWSVLPPEIRIHIAQYMQQLFKNEFWLLPETS